MPGLTPIQMRRGTAADWTAANPTLATGEIGFETDTYKIKIGDGTTVWNSLAYFAASAGTVTSVTAGDTSIVIGGTGDDPTVETATLDVIATDHPPAAAWSNNSKKITSVADPSSAQDAATKNYVDAAVAGSVATDAIWDTKGDLAVGTGANTAAKLTVGSNGDVLTADSGETTGVKWTAPAAGSSAGSSALIYRYTVAGSDKASIDTGVDTADAGDNDWTNGDLLEVWMVIRTDDAGAAPNVDVTLNNDTGAKYDRQQIYGNDTGTGAASSLAQTKWIVGAHGSGGSASYPACLRITIPDFTGTTFFKTGEETNSQIDATAGNNVVVLQGLGFRSTNAITRLKLAAEGAAKLKVGTQLLIYKRVAS